MIYLNEKGDMDTDREMFARSLSLNPDQPELRIIMGQTPYPQKAAPPGTAPPVPSITPPVPGGELPSLPDVLPSAAQPIVPQVPNVRDP